MPRKGHVPRKEVLPDPVYHDIRVAKLANNVMLDGKSLAQRIVYGASTIQERINQDPLEVFNKALENVMPMLKLKPDVSAVQTTRCRSKCVLSVVRRWGSAGSSKRRERKRTHDERPPAGELLTPLTRPVPRSDVKKKCTVWRKRTARSPIPLVTVNEEEGVPTCPGSSR